MDRVAEYQPSIEQTAKSWTAFAPALRSRDFRLFWVGQIARRWAPFCSSSRRIGCSTNNRLHVLAPALAAVGLPKSTWYYHREQKVSYEQKYAHLLPALGAIDRKHPEYGWPRVTVELREAYGHHVNHKVVQRLLKLWDLQIVRRTQRPKPSGIRQVIKSSGKRANLVAQPEEIGLFQVAYTDFTELRFVGGRRKAYLIPIVGHVSKMAFG